MTKTQLRHRLPLVAMAAAAMTLSACGSSPEPAANTSTASATATVPSETGTSVTATSPAPTGSGTPGSESKSTSSSAPTKTSSGDRMLPTSPGDYGDGLISAWSSGDKDELSVYATSAVIAKLKAAKAPKDLLRTTCENGLCSWANEAGARVTMTLDEKKVMAGKQQAVTAVRISS